MSGGGGGGVKLKVYTYCLKRYFLLSKSVHGGGGGQKNVTFERTHFMDDPFTPMHSGVTGGGGAYPNCLYGDGIGGEWGEGGGNYETMCRPREEGVHSMRR